jgi:hypothetical protein
VSRGHRSPICIVTPALAACVMLSSAAAHAAEGDVQWRVSEIGDEALLVSADSEATDNFGPLLFHCRKGSGRATTEGDMSEDLRTTIATLILHDEEPAVTMDPADPSAMGVEAFTGMTGWHYRFSLDVAGPAFQEFGRTGRFHFKIGDSAVSSDFKVGLENARKFQDLCKRPPS